MTTVLIVDDDPDLRFLVDRAITRSGHRALTAGTLDEARHHCRAARPEVLLLDVSMPEADGPTFLAALREEGLAPPHVYLLSALEPEELSPLADALDVEFIVKPFTMQGLRDGLAGVLAPAADGPARQDGPG